MLCLVAEYVHGKQSADASSAQGQEKETLFAYSVHFAAGVVLIRKKHKKRRDIYYNEIYDKDSLHKITVSILLH